jgi:hypothetical protein
VKTLQDILTEAVEDFRQFGFDSEERLLRWERLIREILEQTIRNRETLERQLREQLKTVFDRATRRGETLTKASGVPRFTLANMHTRLHGELDRRVLASAQLIRRNREEMINKTLRRFSGWATSVPEGGSETVDRREVKQDIAKPLRQLPFEERRVLIDQGHKLTSAISTTIAVDGGAIAGKWFSHWRQANYNYRPDHKERDGHFYLVRDSWAHRDGLIKPGPDGYTDEITQPAEEVFCRCRYVWIFHLRQLPPEMITEKGRAAMQGLKAA